jgi:hypothetical protein
VYQACPLPPPSPTPPRRRKARWHQPWTQAEKPHHEAICFPSHSNLTISLTTLVRHLLLEQGAILIRSSFSLEALGGNFTPPPPPLLYLLCISFSSRQTFKVSPKRFHFSLSFPNRLLGNSLLCPKSASSIVTTAILSQSVLQRFWPYPRKHFKPGCSSQSLPQSFGS